MTNEARKLYKERSKRIDDAIKLKEPDRIPIVPDAEFFPLRYAGVTVKEAMYNYDSTYAAWKKTLKEFEWDGYVPPLLQSAIVFDHLDFKQLRWPGHGVGDKSPYQAIEPGHRIDGVEVIPPMQPEEYDWFIDDPSDFMIRSYFPKIFGALEPFSKLPPINSVIMWYQGIFETLSAIGTPEGVKSLESLAKAASEAYKWQNSFDSFINEMTELGFPAYCLSITHSPYDIISNYFRGTRGIMIDMFRNPDKLLQALDKFVPWMIKAGVDGAKATGCPRVAFFIHKGFDGMMSIDQYKTFYWPGVKKIMMGLIEAGLTPYVYTEGDYTSRFEIIKDVPRGKVIYHIEQNIFKAKEVLGDVACLTGGPPNSILCKGTPDDVKEYCKKIIDVVGKGGGFIFEPELPMIDEKPENVKAMTDFVKSYGVYDSH